MAEVLEKRETTPSSLHVPAVEKRIIRMRSPSPGLRGRSQTPIRGRSVTPYQLFREKSATPTVWRSITPFISREEKEKTPFEIGANILQQLASYQAIIDKALVMDISLEEERPAKFILSEHSVIDRAAVMDLSNVEIIYVEDDDELEESDYRESESPASVNESHAPSEDRERSADLTAGSDDEGGAPAGEKKKKTKKAAKKVVKKKEKKEKEPSPPKLKLDLGDSKPKVNKAKMFEKAAEEKPLDKPPPKKKAGGKLTGALAAMKAEESKMKEAEEQKKQIEEKMKKMKAEQDAKKVQAAEEKAAAEAAAAAEEEEDEDREDQEDGSERGSDDEGDEHSGSGSGSGSGSDGEGDGEEQEEEELGEEEQGEENDGRRASNASSVDDFYKPNPEEEGLWSKLDEVEQGIIRSKYQKEEFKKMTERERFFAFQRAREQARIPRIHSHIRDVTISEGNNVKLTCTASGPELNIRWLKDGNPVEKTLRTRILVNEGILSLEILRATASDSGEYTCSLTNQNGEAATSAIVTVYEIMKDDPTPPTFITARDYYHLNDDVLGIEVHCTGVPRPKVQWQHDMFVLQPSFKYTLLEEAHGVYKLEVYKPAAKDSGKYICIATNSVGEAVIEHEVQFIGKPTHFHLHGLHHAHTEYQKEKEEQAKRAMEDALKAKEEYELRRVGKLPPIVKRDDTPNVPQKDRLKFASQLRDRTALIGNKVKFTVSVIGPDPNIRWLKDGNGLQYGPNMRIATAEGMSVVEIINLTTDHTGEYKCVARNNFSEVTTQCYLKVYDAKSEGDKEAPLFVLSMRDVYHGPEKDLVIDCKVRGNPRPLIVWTKDELPIEFDERMQQVEHLDGICELIINKPTPKDSGKYTCTATNNIGTSTTSHQVEYTPHPSLPGSRRDSGMASSVAESDTEKDDKGDEKKDDKAAKGKGARKLPPSEKKSENYERRRPAAPTIEELLKASRMKLSFVTHLTNRVFPEGTKIKLSCVVQGPDPNIRWLFNDQPIVYSPRVRNLSKEGLCVLEIATSNLDDSGVYTCIARNQESDISCSCNVQVYETKSTAEFAPTFTRSLKDTYHLNINELYLETHVRGNPPAKVEWFKDSVDISRDNPKYQIVDHPDGLCEMIVNFPNQNDSGKYVCKAMNKCGTTEIGHYVLFEGKEHHIAENIHGVYHADHSRVDRAKSEAHHGLTDESVESGAAEEEKGKKGGKGQKKTPSRPETPSAPAASAPAPPAKKEPRESRIGINFPTKLSNRVVAAGSKVKLTCYLEGADPSIRWFKDDQPVVYSPKLRQNQLNGLCSLEFTTAAIDDSGEYKCWARNTSGETSTSCTLEVFSSGDSADLSPTFTRSVKETYNSKINEINITCHVRAIPKASITWSKDGVTIEPSDKYQLIEHDDGLCELNISDATKQDNGKYGCIAENRAGKTETSHIVQITIREQRSSVSSLSSIKESPPTPVPEEVDDKSAAGKGKGQPRQKKEAAPSGGGRRYGPVAPPDPKQHLHFIAFLNDRTIPVGGKTKISCWVGGPDPQARWFKDENPLVMSPRVRVEARDGLLTLMIQSAVVEDAGDYRILVRNPASEITSSCTLNVYETITPTATVPLFTNSIKDTYNLIANELVVECRVRGEPQPTIRWTKDGNFIDLNDKYQQIDQPDGVCRLVIYTPDEKDSGLYVCKAENSAGSDSTSHNVVFDGKNSYINEKTHGYFHRDPNKPQFQNQLGNHLVTAGGTIALQAEIINEPSEVRWLCEKVPIVLGEKVRSIYDHGIYTLIISEANKEQSGTYTCQAINAFGKTELQAHVHIVGPSVKGGKCPLFLSRPDNEMKIQTGDPFSFSFRLIGDPKPKLILLKGIRDITQNDRTLKEAHDDFIRFSVQNSKPNDSGTYCIVARNQHGTDRAFVTITVKERARSVIPVRSNWLNVSDEYSDVSSYLKNPPAAISSEPIVIDNGKTHLSISWQKPINVDAAPVIAYRVEAWLIGAEGGARWQELGITPINCFDAFNLKAGAQYHFRVTPRNRYGWGHSVQTSSPITVGAFATLPEFTKILPGQIKVLLGQDFFFLECIYKGKPRPHIVWYKDEIPLDQNDERITMRILGTSTCRLEIRDVQSSDSGRYTCEATNTQGRVSTFARLQAVANYRIYEVDNKLKQRINGETDITEDTLPQFAMRLRDRRIQSSYPVRLSCQAVGLPVPEITWFKDNQQLTTSERYVILNEDTFSTLEIMRATLDDSGTYTATATNEHGQISCHCSLIVDKGIRAYIAPEFLGSLEPDYNVKYGHEIRLCAQIEAYPTVGVNWYRNGAKIRPSRRIVPTLDDDGFVELVISNATFDDAGAYRCVATNVVGKAESTCNVTIDTCDSMIIPSICEPNIMPYSKEPMFIKKPRSFEAFEGDTVMIDCEILADSDQKVEVVWLRDFLKPEYYKDAPHFRRIGNGPSYCLEIPRAKLDYTGTYTVVASNCYGSTKAIISLQIYAKDLNNAMDKTKNITHGNIETLPIFKRQLKDVRCCDGDSVRLECHVESTPAPNIYWEKDGKKLQQISDDFSMSYDVGGRAILSIKRVYPEDEGEYKCVASNSIGKTFSLACIIVDVAEEKENLLSRQLTRPSGFLSANSTPLSTPRATPIRSMSPMSMTMSYRSSNMNVAQQRHNKFMSPKFYAVPHSRVAEEGETVQFQCAIAGHPTPWSTWDQDGQIVTPTTRITIKERDDLRILEIDEVTHEDAGLYRITLENEYGRIEATARLDIIGTGRSAAGRGIRTGSSPRRNISVSRRLMGSSTRIGGRLALAANFRGTSAPARKFYHNGNDVNLDDPRIKITENDANINLTIDNVQSKDEGIYTCIAENEFSIAASSVYVTLFQDESEIVKQAPEIVRSLESIQIVESGQHLDLTCQVQSFTPFEVQWKYNSKMIPANTEEYRLIDHGDGLIALRILNPLAIDSGFYICMVASEYGCCSTSCEVTIKEAEEVVRETIPIFIDEPVPVVAMHGSVVSFCARVSPSSSKVKWFVCGREITESSRGTIIESNDDGLKNLHILGVEHRHSGEIQCTIYNPLNPGLAQRSCYTDLAVLPRPIQLANVDVDPDTSPFFVHSQTVNCADLNPNTTITQQAFKPIADIPAYLIRGPDDCTALIGGTICLAVSYGGYPKPQIKWLRAGHVLTESEDIQIKIGNGSSMLILTNVQADQSGKYTVEVMNLHNCDIAAASVAVESTPDPPSGRPCISQGVDRVSIAWCGPPYDGGCIITGFILEVQQGDNDWQEYATIVDSLAYTIKDLQPNNAYRFRVRAENIHGRSEPSLCSDVVAINANNGYSTITNGLSAINLSKDYPENSDDSVDGNGIVVRQGGDFKARFVLEEELGKGRFGIVHRVVERETGQVLAAKIVKCIKAKDKLKIQEEISIMRALRHPKLLQLAAAFETSREMIMVMEYITGGELFERVVADDFTLTEHDCILFIRQICEGVDYMHSQSIVHLDLKPENIMCHTRTTHKIKIIDFGLAQRIETDSPIRVMFGTPEFISPEILNYEPIGFKSDMWSVGVICYVLLSGLSPFMGDSDVDTFANITRADYDFDDEAFDAVTQNAKDFISSLMVHRKEDRLSAKQCLESTWLSQQNDDSASKILICTDKLKKFIIRRKWQKTGNAIRALGRMATLSANSRRNSSSSNVTNNSPRPSIGNGSHITETIKPPMQPLNEVEIVSEPIPLPPPFDIQKVSVADQPDNVSSQARSCADVDYSMMPNGPKENNARLAKEKTCTERSDSGFSDCSNSSNGNIAGSYAHTSSNVTVAHPLFDKINLILEEKPNSEQFQRDNTANNNMKEFGGKVSVNQLKIKLEKMAVAHQQESNTFDINRKVVRKKLSAYDELIDSTMEELNIEQKRETQQMRTSNSFDFEDADLLQDTEDQPKSLPIKSAQKSLMRSASLHQKRIVEKEPIMRSDFTNTVKMRKKSLESSALREKQLHSQRILLEPSGKVSKLLRRFDSQNAPPNDDNAATEPIVQTPGIDGTSKEIRTENINHAEPSKQDDEFVEILSTPLAAAQKSPPLKRKSPAKVAKTIVSSCSGGMKRTIASKFEYTNTKTCVTSMEVKVSSSLSSASSSQRHSPTKFTNISNAPINRATPKPIENQTRNTIALKKSKKSTPADTSTATTGQRASRSTTASKTSAYSSFNRTSPVRLSGRVREVTDRLSTPKAIVNIVKTPSPVRERVETKFPAKHEMAMKSMSGAINQQIVTVTAETVVETEHQIEHTINGKLDGTFTLKSKMNENFRKASAFWKAT